MKNQENEQTIVTEGGSDIVRILPVDFFVGASCTSISIGTSNWLGDAS